MQLKPTISVVVPVYNEAEQLGSCLDSLLEQADELAEIIIVDNNSTDGSLELAQSYARDLSLIKVIREKRQGLVPARNRGFLAASSDIVARIDADTRVQSGWSAAIRQYFSDNPEVQAITGPTRYYDLPCEKVCEKISSLILGDVNRAVSGFDCLYGPNMALRRGVVRKLAKSTCRGSINEDLDLTIHLHQHGQMTATEPAMLAYISGRRMKSSPLSFYLYTLNWSRTYFKHKKYRSAVLAYILTLVFCSLQTILLPILRAWDEYERQLSWRQLMSYAEDRIIP